MITVGVLYWVFVVFAATSAYALRFLWCRCCRYFRGFLPGLDHMPDGCQMVLFSPFF